MDRCINDDVESGINREIVLFNHIKKYFEETAKNKDTNIKRSNNKFSEFDFYGDYYKYELKSRNYSSDGFFNKDIDTSDKVMMNKSKIDLCNPGDVFIFEFKDLIAYIRFNKNKFDNYVCKNIISRYRSYHNDKPHDYIYIPISELMIMKNKESAGHVGITVRKWREIKQNK
jgi:hypothetical protein